ncbi:hypothetical protein CIB84_016262 [Bambusicola thoracicus]|uniref:Uncharacterized protein n=1 Tax=Bambusicola thoracicus TaxID=9083 RepID=A0A2P4S7B1_BAMTH|nr:hypothetical protein CIB84_016262 [Bambusicola thoracicus]
MMHCVLPSVVSCEEAQIAAAPMTAFHSTAVMERRCSSKLKPLFLPALLKTLT